MKLMTLVAAVMMINLSLFAQENASGRWFVEDAQTVAAALSGQGVTTDGVWSGLDGQVTVEDSKVVFDADDETAVAYRPNVPLVANGASVTMANVVFSAVRKTLPAPDTSSQAAVALTTNGNGQCVFAVVDGGAWTVTAVEADPAVAYTVRADFAYGESSKVSYYLVDGQTETPLLVDAANPGTVKVSTVEFAGSGSFASLGGVYPIATIDFGTLPEGVASVTVNGQSLVSGKASVPAGTQAVIEITAADGWRVAPTRIELESVAEDIDFSENFPATVTKILPWSIVSADGTETNGFETLSAALEALQDGETLMPEVAGESDLSVLPETFSKEDFDAVPVNCPFVITNNEVTVDFRGRVLRDACGEVPNDYLISVVGATNVSVRNGFLFGTTWREPYDYTPGSDHRGFAVANGAWAIVSNCVVFIAATSDSVAVTEGSRLRFVNCWIDGQGDGAKQVFHAAEGSRLRLVDTKGFWNPDNFWGATDGVVDTLPAITGEQFALEDSYIFLDNTIISNTVTHWSEGKVVTPVTFSGEANSLSLVNGAFITATDEKGAVPVVDLTTDGTALDSNADFVIGDEIICSAEGGVVEKSGSEGAFTYVAHQIVEIGVTVNGVDLSAGSGEGWTLSDGTNVVLDGTVPYEIAGDGRMAELVFSAPNGAEISSAAIATQLRLVEPLGGTLKIANGTVGLDGFNGDSLIIDGGSVQVADLSSLSPAASNSLGQAVWCVTVPNVAGSAAVAVSEIANYGRDSIYPVDGCVCFWLPDGEHYFRVDGKPYTATVAGGHVTAYEREGVLFRANQIGVCSWTWHASISNILECMERGGYNGMQLALAPWLGIEQGSLLFGGGETEEMWNLVKAAQNDGRLNVMSTMINFPGEDYSSLTSISNTQGYMYGVLEGWPDSDEHWKSNLFYTVEAAKLTAELGVEYLTTEIGFIEVAPELMFDRIKEICASCAVYNVTFLMESGPQTAFGMTNLLARLNAEGITNVGVNYDPGDDELFGSEGAVDSFNAMWPWIRQCHIKDCKHIGEPQRKNWNTDCPWGEGYVSTMPFDGDKDFLATLRLRRYDGNILFEYMTVEDGEPEYLTPAREERIQDAMLTILTSNNTDDPTELWRDSVWVKPSVMMGTTDGERARAAMKAQGFDAESAAIIAARPYSYLTLKTWAEATAAERKYGPKEAAKSGSALLSAAIGAPELLKADDVKVAATELDADGTMALEMKLGDGPLTVVDAGLIKAAFGVLGSYSLEAGEAAFSAANVTLGEPVVDATAGTITTTATPQPINDEIPGQFFFRTVVK